MKDILFPAVVVALVVISSIRSFRKSSTSTSTRTIGFTLRTRKVTSPEEMERALENPQVQEQLRKAGIDPTVLEQELHSGTAHMEDGRLVLSRQGTLAPGSLPPEVMKDAKPLSPEEAVRVFEETGMAERLRKAGKDPDEFLAKLRTGEEKVYGTTVTSRVVVSHDVKHPPEGVQAPAAPLPATPATEQLAPPSDDGDKVWKTGKL